MLYPFGLGVLGSGPMVATLDIIYGIEDGLNSVEGGFLGGKARAAEAGVDANAELGDVRGGAVTLCTDLDSCGNSVKARRAVLSHYISYVTRAVKAKYLQMLTYTRGNASRASAAWISGISEFTIRNFSIS